MWGFPADLKMFSLDTVDDRLTNLWLMGSWTLTRIHINIWPAAVWTTPTGQIWTVQTRQDTRRRTTPSQTTWPKHSVVHTLPVLPPDEIILMASHLTQRTDDISQNRHKRLQATSKLCVWTEVLGSDTSHRQDQVSRAQGVMRIWKTGQLITNDCVLCVQKNHKVHKTWWHDRTRLPSG